VLANGEVLVESVAICEYLEEIYPGHPLLPKDPVLKAKIRGFCEIINSGIHPYQNLRLLKRVEVEGVDKMKFAAEWVNRGMETCEKYLQKTKGKYCFGDEVTLADAFFYPHVVGGIARFGVKIEDFPLCKEVLANLQELEAFRLAEPKAQPDF
jgi:maleylacetoacetate isomerase